MQLDITSGPGIELPVLCTEYTPVELQVRAPVPIEHTKTPTAEHCIGDNRSAIASPKKSGMLTPSEPPGPEIVMQSSCMMLG